MWCDTHCSSLHILTPYRGLITDIAFSIRMISSTTRSLSVLACAAVLLALLAACPGPVSARTAEEWKTRSIYQIITDRFALPPPSNSTSPCANIRDYCGGTYTGITAHLDYITQLGFNAIWISPVVLNVPHAFHGYAAIDLWQLNPHFGTREEFTAMVSALHARDVWLMVDVVANHMANVPKDGNFSGFHPFDQPEHYHDCAPCDQYCSIPTSAWAPHNMTVIEHCRLDGLADLDQDQPFVRRTLLDWIQQMVQNYSIDGLRVDTVPEVKRPFWQQWQQRAGVYAVGEVFDTDVQYVASYQAQALNATLSYPLFFAMRQVFGAAKPGLPITALQSLYEEYSAAFPDPSILGSFADNHDNARFLSQVNDSSLYLNALTYTLTSRGIPIVYYGTEQGYRGQTDPYDREPLWTSGYGNSSLYFSYLRLLNGWRQDQAVWERDQQQFVYGSGQEAAFLRGESLVVLSQRGRAGGSVQLSIKVGDALSGELIGLFDSADRVIVSQGQLTVTLTDGLPKVYTRTSAVAKAARA